MLCKQAVNIYVKMVIFLMCINLYVILSIEIEKNAKIDKVS